MTTTRTLTEVRSDICGCIHRGEHEMEAGFPYENPLNDLQRELIATFAAQHGGEAWLGKVNLYDGDNRERVLWKWDGGMVLNFGASFVIPAYDDQLERLILKRDRAPYTGTREDYRRVTEIYDRMEAVGGMNLLWN